jgi:hypothetical protein
MDTAEYLIHEGAGIEVYAEVRYTIQPAYGDGYHEPHEPAHVELGKITLHKRTRRVTTERKVAGDGYNYIWVYDITDLGEAPAWVDDVIAADEDWQSDLIAGDYDDSDRRYDEARDDAMMGDR